MGTDSERLTIEVDERGGVFVGERWVATVVGQAAIDLTREALAAASEPVGMTVPEMIEWLDGGGELEGFSPYDGKWCGPITFTAELLTAWPNPEVRRPQYRRRVVVEVAPDKVPLTRLIGRTLIGHKKIVEATELRFAVVPPHGPQWLCPAGEWLHLPIDDAGLVAVKPIEAS